MQLFLVFPIENHTESNREQRNCSITATITMLLERSEKKIEKLFRCKLVLSTTAHDMMSKLNRMNSTVPALPSR